MKYNDLWPGDCGEVVSVIKHRS